MNPKKLSERLMERLKRDGWNIPEGSTFQRLYPGHWQRSAGAWVWLISRPGDIDIGSIAPARVCLTAKRLENLGWGEIFPED